MSRTPVFPIAIMAVGIAYFFFGDGSDTKTHQSSSYTAVELVDQEAAAWSSAVRVFASVKARGCGVFTVSKNDKTSRRAVYNVQCDRGGHYKIGFDMNVVSHAGGDLQRF